MKVRSQLTGQETRIVVRTMFEVVVIIFARLVGIVDSCKADLDDDVEVDSCQRT